MCLAPWIVVGAMTTGLFLSMPVKGIAQQQTPTYSAEEQAALQEADELNQQVDKLYQEGKYTTAIPLAERALAIREKVLGKEHPDVATSLNNLAFLYQRQGKYQQAESLYQRSLAIRKKVLGKEHPAVATSLNNLAELYRAQEKYQQAEPLYLRALAIWEKVLGQEHLNVASSLNNLALLYLAQDNYQQAEPLFQRSLAIAEKIFGKEHPNVATSLNNLAQLYDAQGKYQQAEPLYQRSLAIREKVLGNEHPDVATSLNNLAALYRVQGKYQQAEPLYQRSLAIREKVLGNEHPDVATSLNNLAALYDAQGKYQQAEPLYQRSLAIFEKVLGEEHPDVATSLNNLAFLHSTQGKYQQAEPLYQRSLAIREKVLGNEHPDVATSLNNLAALYYAQGKYQQAEPLYQRSLAIRKKVLGQQHPDIAQSLNNLAELYRVQGKYQQAEPFLQRSLAIFEKVLGKEHPDVATSLNNLAILYLSQGDITRAVDFLRRGLEVEAQNLNLIFAVGSEKSKQDYIRTFSDTTNTTVSLSLQEARNNSAAASLALTTVLRRKGLVLDAVADSIQILRSKLDKNPETQKLFTQWLQVQQQLSALVFSDSGKQTANLKTQLEQLEAEREKIEAAISTKSAEFRQQTQPVELGAIQAKITKDAALVEIVQYYPFNAKAKTDAEKFGKPRYAAAVLRSTGEPKLLDLGEAAEIDKLAIDFRAALATGRSFKKLARTLDEKLIAPIRPLLGDASHILISPDGQLTLIPFEALKDEQDKFLIQRYAFSYLTSGRDLLGFQSNVNNASAPVVLADIDYNNQKQTVVAAQASGVRGLQNRRSGDLANLIFDPLAATKEEAAAIKKVLPNAKVLLGKDATETAVKQLQSPSILHLATHGFFITDVEQNLNASSDLELTPRQPKILQVENPLLRSGLALAGFNQRKQATNNNDDGVLTALEVAGLDLRSTELVVLSACDTGKGDIKVGDGVYGLRRALVIAGSQTQVLSLWLVDDAATKDLMVKYYQNLKVGKGRHEALRSAQLDLLNSQEYEHPQYWAAFLPSGNWTPLRGL
ncbi:CHAT domain-containing protein [Fortiea sp. LEGE XX443]|nr:CHAT domain-containing tetratricopeptide repeat protein [Fortiea sp. LEGE XX443]MBE9004106.1 CHAT domain-containing protein [Fortiea sp. LEGE XX443]